MNEILRVFTNWKGFERPPTNYCLSRWQRDIGFNIQDQRAKAGTKAARTPEQKEDFALKLDARIDQRIAKYEAVMQAAAQVAGGNYDKDRQRWGDKPVGKISDNETTQELLDSIRKLTRALEAASGKLPRALEAGAKEVVPNVRAGAIAASHSEQDPAASPGAMLPPIRQEFPVVQ